MRRTYTLSDTEQDRFHRLLPIPGAALSFWANAAEARGLDPKSVISNGESFSALPAGHDRHWCYPIPLKCKFDPHKH